MLQNKTRRRYERGNAFIFILLGIALFAGLAFTISRSMRSQTTTTLSSRDADLAATDIMSYNQALARAVDRVRRKGCSENDISFEQDNILGYEHGAAVPDKCKIFHPDGGNITWQTSPIENRAYEFWGNNDVQGIGASPASELIVALPMAVAHLEVCSQYNKKAGAGATIATGGDDEDETKFTGGFGDSLTSITETPGRTTACFDADGSGSYLIYSVLLQR